MQRLAGSFHVIAPDYPGFGQSPALSGTTTFEAGEHNARLVYDGAPDPAGGLGDEFGSASSS